MKKALAGPAKRTSKKRKSKKLPERRAMIAAVRRRIEAALTVAAKGTRRVDRAVARRAERMRPTLARRFASLRASGQRAAKAMARRLRPLGILVLRLFARGERLL